MARTVAFPVTPGLLVWARESVGLGVDEAARKARVKKAQLEGWEKGDGMPSLAQAEKLADAYKRPVALFLLENPPEEAPLPEDYRMLPGWSEKQG